MDLEEGLALLHELLVRLVLDLARQTLLLLLHPELELGLFALALLPQLPLPRPRLLRRQPVPRRVLLRLERKQPLLPPQTP